MTPTGSYQRSKRRFPVFRLPDCLRRLRSAKSGRLNAISPQVPRSPPITARERGVMRWAGASLTRACRRRGTEKQADRDFRAGCAQSDRRDGLCARNGCCRYPPTGGNFNPFTGPAKRRKRIVYQRLMCGGGSGIRTHGTRKYEDYQSVALNRSPASQPQPAKAIADEMAQSVRIQRIGLSGNRWNANFDIDDRKRAPATAA